MCRLWRSAAQARRVETVVISSQTRVSWSAGTGRSGGAQSRCLARTGSLHEPALLGRAGRTLS